MFTIFSVLNFKLKFFCNQDGLTYNVDYYSCTDKYLSDELDTQ